MTTSKHRLRFGVYGAEFTDPAAMSRLTAIADVIRLSTVDDPVSRSLRDFDLVWLRLEPPITVSDVPPEPRCRIVAVPATGTDHVDAQALSARGVRLLALSGRGDELRHLTATSDLALLLILASVRRLLPAVESVKQGEWDREAFRGREIGELKVGLVGIGRVSSNLARALLALGADVAYVDPAGPAEVSLTRFKTVRELAEWCDVLSVHVPLNPTTVGLVDDQVLEALGPGGVLINTSRGAIIDEGSLLERLNDGRLGAAGLDVCQGEGRFRFDHPIASAARTLPNLVVTPHIGGNTVGSTRKADLLLVRDVEAAVLGSGRR